MDLKISVLEFNDCSSISILDITGDSLWYNSLIPLDKTQLDSLGLSNEDKAKWLNFYGLSTGAASWEVTRPAVSMIIKTTSGTSGLKSISNLLIDHGPFGIEDVDYIKVYSTSNARDMLFRRFIGKNDASFYITAHELGFNTMPDGIYNITYKALNADGSESQTAKGVQSVVFISGNVRNKVYKSLAKLPIATNNLDLRENYFTEVLYAYTLLRACENSNYVSQIDDLINGLKTLEKFLSITKCFKHHIDD